MRQKFYVVIGFLIGTLLALAFALFLMRATAHLYEPVEMRRCESSGALVSVLHPELCPEWEEK